MASLSVRDDFEGDVKSLSLQYLEQQEILNLYHFTDYSNLPSIREHGLLSLAQSLKLNLRSQHNSNGLFKALDQMNNTDDFVHLSFCSQHPMMYQCVKEGRLGHPVVLRIDVSIVDNDYGTRFTDQNVAKTRTIKYDLAEDATKKLNFKIFNQDYLHLDEENKIYFQAEVLIPKHVPVDFIHLTSFEQFERIYQSPPIKWSDKEKGVILVQYINGTTKKNFVNNCSSFIIKKYRRDNYQNSIDGSIKAIVYSEIGWCNWKSAKGTGFLSFDGIVIQNFDMDGEDIHHKELSKICCFPKYRNQGKTYQDLLRENPKYLRWLVNNKKVGRGLLSDALVYYLQKMGA